MKADPEKTPCYSGYPLQNQSKQLVCSNHPFVNSLHIWNFNVVFHQNTDITHFWNSNYIATYVFLHSLLFICYFYCVTIIVTFLGFPVVLASRTAFFFFVSSLYYHCYLFQTNCCCQKHTISCDPDTFTYWHWVEETNTHSNGKSFREIGVDWITTPVIT